MLIKDEKISVLDQKWQQFTLINDNGMEVSCLNYGGIITKMLVPDRNNKLENVVLSYRNFQDYLNNPNYFGALIGRVAGRIQGAAFTLNNQTYQLTPNEGKHHLHGGPTGFHQVIWSVKPYEHKEEVGLHLTHTSPDGEGGYPGTIEAKITYSLNNDNQFSIAYDVTTDKLTAFTATNHSYFNLSGNLKSDIKDHVVTADSSRFVELDEELIPTGNKPTVDDTVFDFRHGRVIKDGVVSGHPQNIIAGNGYDHYFILDKSKESDIIVQDVESGRELVVTTDHPGFVMYSSNGLDDNHQLTETKSSKHLGLCLETQESPASLHHSDFPSCVLERDASYSKKTTFTFGIVKN